MQPALIVDMANEARQPLHHVPHRLVLVAVHLLALQGLHEAFRLGVAVGVPLAAHRTQNS